MKVSKKLKRKRRKQTLLVLVLVTAFLVLMATMKSLDMLGGNETNNLSAGDTVNIDGLQESNQSTENEQNVENVAENDVSDASISASQSASLYNLKSSYSASSQSFNIASGNNFVVAVKSDGTVWTWGNNQYGQRGNGVAENVSSNERTQVVAPEYVASTDEDEGNEVYLTGVRQVSAGTNFASALTSDGKVVCWGLGTSGQLGNLASVTSNIPVYVVDVDGNEIDDVIQIACGNSHTLALTSERRSLGLGLRNNLSIR